MEEEEGKYADGKIYMIFVVGCEDFCYIGSTIQELHVRFNDHKWSAQSKAIYKFASAPFFDEGNEVIIKLIEAYPCETRSQLLTREAYWCGEYPEAVNKNTPILTNEERHRRQKACMLAGYYKKHEERKAKHKEWLAANTAHTRAYLETNKDKIRAQEAARNAAGYGEVRAAKKKVEAECDMCQKRMNKNSLWTHKKICPAKPPASQPAAPSQTPPS